MTRRGGRDERVGWDAGEGSVVDRVLVISLSRRIVSFCIKCTDSGSSGGR